MGKYNLSEVLPHKSPMILLEDILEVNTEKNYIKTIFVPDKSMVFAEKQGIDSLVGLECMAQSIGCYAYFKNGCKEPKMGLLLGTRVYNNTFDYFSYGAQYVIEAKEAFSDGEIVSFDCKIFDESDKEIASANINAYQSDNVKEFIINGQ